MAGCVAKGAMTRPGKATTRPGKATTRPSNAATQPRGRRDTVGSARARDLAGGECRDTKHCIVTGARVWPLGVVSRYSLCIVTGRRFG